MLCICDLKGQVPLPLSDLAVCRCASIFRDLVFVQHSKSIPLITPTVAGRQTFLRLVFFQIQGPAAPPTEQHWPITATTATINSSTLARSR